jgi:2-polyprenyl-6-methoxyphenol hydroxylase-like FAD-dependent oxidoreductase
MTRTQVDALVVGAGPVGMTLALELLRHGLSCRIVDLAPAPTIYSKAQVIHARTLEIFEAIGHDLVSELLARGKKLRGVNVFEGGRRITHLALGTVDAPYPFKLCIAQRDTELVLEAALAARGCPVERSVRLESFETRPDGVSALLVHETDHEKDQVSASFLFGCDGAHSTVRKGLGLELEGSTYEFRLIQADVHVELPSDLSCPDDEICAFLSPEGPVAFFPLAGPKRYRQLVFLDQGQDLEPTLENFQLVAKTRARADVEVSDPAWTVGFKIHARLASKLRQGRVFLAGDAAHIHSPAGGQGMNMGMQDAFNLGWKVALVHRGRGKESLLDSYEAERRPIHEATLHATDAATRRGRTIATLTNPVAKELRNRVLGFAGSLGLVQDSLARAVSMLDVGYGPSAIVTQHRGSILSARVLPQVLAGRETEAPSLADWLHFGDGPEPGRRAVDAPIHAASGRAESGERLFDLLPSGSHTGHTLLLFDGAAATAEGYRTLARIAREAKTRCGAEVVVHVILPVAGPRPPAALDWDESLVFDEDGAIHRRYGARSECAYVIRPDGHVGFRCQPADPAAIAAYWDAVFR